ncbi:MAG: ribonuclease HII [Candidatus Gastranaerophilales bacterium]|nr:ribonuclease HII [Candidatus Gastranaerophilales bacterium]
MKSNDLFQFDKDFLSSPSLAQGSKSIDFGGGSFLIGTDEAGRGPGAGGVFASAVYFPNPNKELIEKLSALNDSKKLSKKKREELYEIIIANSINSTVCVEVEEIEKINILNASLKAMKLACKNVISEIQSRVGLLSHQQKVNILVLVDGNKKIKDCIYLQQTIVKGDSKSASIAAASILAKVTRDRYMTELDKQFPQYNWKQNAGYLTKEHFEAIKKYGITPIHRKSFLQGKSKKQKANRK